MFARTLISVALLAALTGCNDSGQDDQIKQPAQLQAEAKVYFSPEEGRIPTPNDLLFAGSTDGTLVFPRENLQDLSNPKVHLSALDGWSTIAPFFIAVSEPLDASSLVAGQTVRLFEAVVGLGATTPDPQNPCAVAPAKVVCAVVRELSTDEFSVGLEAVSSGHSNRIQITPKQPLKAGSAYVYSLTQGIKTAEGRLVISDGPYQIAHQTTPLDASSPFKGLQGAIQQIEQNLKKLGVDQAKILLSGSFSTQSISPVLAMLKQVIEASPAPQLQVTKPLGSTGLYIPGGRANALLMAGQINLPYYLKASQGPQDLSALSAFWQSAQAVAGERNLTRYNPLPAKTGDETIPVLLSVPSGAKPAAGWPVVIFQHGFTRSRADLIPMAETFAAAGFAAVSIDLPLHGIAAAADYPATDPLKALAPLLHQGYASNEGQVHERTFGLDVLSADGSATPDGVADGSGLHFVNLSSLLTTRDNLRQGVADLMALKKALATANVDGIDGADFDSSRVAFVGHSLGGIVGTTFASLNPDLKSVVLVAPGGGVSKLLLDSKAFGPRILAGLAAKGLAAGTSAFEDFVWLSQTVLDAGDPLNYAAQLKASPSPVYFAQMVGNASLKLPSDVVVSNSVPGAPLSGSDPLVKALGLVDTKVSGQSPTGLKVRVNFSQGEHGTLLTPNSSLNAGLPAGVWREAMVELHTQIASFLASDGKVLQVSNSNTLQ